MMSRQEPQGLAPDAEPIMDYRAKSDHRADAIRGSNRLRQAILASMGIKPVRKQKAPKLAHVPADYRQRIEKRYGSTEDRQLAIRQIERLQRVVAGHFGIKVQDLTDWRGPQKMVERRQIAIYLARTIVRSSYPDIGKCFGGKDHSTVIHACRMVETKPELAETALKLRKRLGA